MCLNQRFFGKNVSQPKVILCIAGLAGSAIALLDWGMHQVDLQILTNALGKYILHFTFYKCARQNFKCKPIKIYEVDLQIQMQLPSVLEKKESQDLKILVGLVQVK